MQTVDPLYVRVSESSPILHYPRWKFLDAIATRNCPARVGGGGRRRSKEPHTACTITESARTSASKGINDGVLVLFSKVSVIVQPITYHVHAIAYRT
jgi:hypothetical protein